MSITYSIYQLHNEKKIWICHVYSFKTCLITLERYKKEYFPNKITYTIKIGNNQYPEYSED